MPKGLPGNEGGTRQIWRDGESPVEQVIRRRTPDPRKKLPAQGDSVIPDASPAPRTPGISQDPDDIPFLLYCTASLTYGS